MLTDYFKVKILTTSANGENKQTSIPAEGLYRYALTASYYFKKSFPVFFYLVYRELLLLVIWFRCNLYRNSRGHI